MMAVEPFTVHVPDEILVDLRERLARTRWPGEIPGAAWDYGSNLAYIKELVDYWRTQLRRDNSQHTPGNPDRIRRKS